MKYGTIAKAIVQNGDGKVLVLTIGEHTKYPQLSNTPDLPGGIIGAGEEPRVGVQREILEEIGIHVALSDVHELHRQVTHVGEHDYEMTRVLYFVRVADPSVTLSYEHESYKWTMPDELWHVKFSGLYFDNFIEIAFDRLRQERLLD